MSNEFPFDSFFETQVPLKNTKNLLHLEAEIHHQLRQVLAAEKYSAYFENHLKISDLADSNVKMTVTSDFIKFMVESQFLKEIHQIAEEVVGPNLNIKIEVESKIHEGLSSNKNNILKTITDEALQSENKPKKVSEVKFLINNLHPTKQDKISTADSSYMRHLEESRSILLDSSKTFDNFIVGPSNNLAFTISQTISKNPNRKENKGVYPSVFIYGNSGLGKSHLLHAIANQVKLGCPDLLVYLVSGREFISEFVSALSSKTTKEFQEKYYEKIDVLIIDDIHEIGGKDETQNEFFHIFNLMMQKGKQLIFTADKRPSEIRGLSERIQSRLQGCLLVDVQKPDFETRMAILKKRMVDFDIFIPEEILSLIAFNIQNNIRELESALIGLHAQANILNKNIDELLVKELLNKSGNFSSPSLTIDQVCKAVSLYFKIPLPDLKSKSRSGEISKARHIAMFLIKKHLRLTLIDIAEYFGGRDHSSVIHAINKIKVSSESETQISRDISSIESNF